MKDENAWYRKLLIYSLPIGIVGGVAAVLFTSITNGGSNFLFGERSTDPWSGSLYWIPLTSFGAILVTFVRKKLSVAKNVPGAVELAKLAWIEPSGALPLILVAVLSIIFGASLGPSFGIIVLGGGFASWLVTKIGPKFEREEQKEFARTGMAGSLGSVFGAPIIATLLTVELSPSKKQYTMTVITRLISSSLGYIIYFGITGAVILNAFSLPAYEYKNTDLFVGALLGLVAILFFLLFVFFNKVTSKIINMIKNDYSKALIGGAAIGFISFALPLTFGSGNSQLASVTSEYTLYGAGLLFIILIGKTIALRLSQESGFIGGVVFPILFFSGVAGVLIHTLVPEIPIALAVGAMMATVPGAALTAPISLILIATASLSQSSAIIPPLTIAVAVTQSAMYLLNNIKQNKNKTIS
jgi:H+/Cl- antiporter ClcA